MLKLGYGAALAIGAALMYGLDPNQGRRRRARFRDEADHLAHAAVRSANKAVDDASHRLHGVGARLRSRSESGRIEDEVLAERVRSSLGRCCSHPHAIRASVANGVVELRGPILAAEASSVLSNVRRVAGVLEARDALERHAGADVPSLQGSRPLPRHGLARSRWSPSARWAVGGTGAALLMWGARRGPPGIALAALGAAALLRATTNRDFAALFGATDHRTATRRGAIDVTKTIAVQAPVREVFDYFTAFENFPRFMQHVRDLKRLNGDRWHWKVQGPGGLSFEWDAIVTGRVDGEYVAWKSTEAAAIQNRGEARFEPLPDGSTRVTIHLAYDPPLGAIGHAIAKLFGADPKRELDDDMLRFKSLLERGKVTGRNGVVRREDLAGAKPAPSDKPS
jgi:uncharacterized membrane protein